MTGFVSRKLDVPGHRVRPIGLRNGEKVHSPGSPGDGTVGDGIMRMQHNRHPELALSGSKTKAETYCGAEFLQKEAIINGKGIGPFRVNYLIIRCVYGIPSEVAGVVAGKDKLGFKGRKSTKKQCDKYDKFPSHSTKIGYFT
jgi:hypothetical protein